MGFWGLNGYRGYRGLNGYSGYQRGIYIEMDIEGGIIVGDIGI